MADGNYDSTNSGVFFKPHEDQKLIGQGRLDVEGAESRIVVVKERLKRDGDPVFVVYQRMGVLFPNDKKGNDKAPDRSGPLDAYPDHRVAAWQGEKDGRRYMSLKVSRKQQDGQSGGSSSGGTAPAAGQWDDDIPF